MDTIVTWGFMQQAALVLIPSCQLMYYYASHAQSFCALKYKGNYD